MQLQMQTWTFHGPPDYCKCLRNQTGRPEVDRTKVWREAIGNETRRCGTDRPAVWHVPNGTVVLQTKKKRRYVYTSLSHEQLVSDRNC